MLNNITWQGYWVTLAIISLGYYLVIYALFYRKDFKVLIPPHQEASPLRNDSATSKGQGKASVENDDGLSSPGQSDAAVFDCMDELTAFFEESKRSKCVKEELLYALQPILSKYPSLKNSQYQDSINNVIASEAKQHCSLQLSREEMIHVWLER